MKSTYDKIELIKETTRKPISGLRLALSRVFQKKTEDQTHNSGCLSRWIQYRNSDRSRGDTPNPNDKNTTGGSPNRTNSTQVWRASRQEVPSRAGSYQGATSRPEIEQPCISNRDRPLTFRFVKLSINAITPRRGTPGSVGYDLFTPIEFTLQPKEQSTIFIDIAVQIPDGYYGQVAPKSGLATLHEIDVRAGVIDPDYTGNIGVVLKNDSDQPFERLGGGTHCPAAFHQSSYPFPSGGRPAAHHSTGIQWLWNPQFNLIGITEANLKGI